MADEGGVVHLHQGSDGFGILGGGGENLRFIVLEQLLLALVREDLPSRLGGDAHLSHADIGDATQGQRLFKIAFGEEKVA